MLKKYDVKLDELRDKMRRRGNAEAMLDELKRQKEKLAARERMLRGEFEKEQANVERLTSGFWSIYYMIIGKKEDMLEKERAEMLKASSEYEAAQIELRRVEEQIEQLEWDLRDMANAEIRYRETLDEKLKAMREMGIEADQITPIDEKLRRMNGKLREIKQAYTAGRRVIGQLDTIENELSQAESYGRADLYGMSSLITQVGKYAHFDTAKQHTRQLQRFVDEFQKELADIRVNAQVYVEMDSFTRFADWFFDGIFADLSALRKIEESKSSVRMAQIRVEKILDRLNEMKREMEREMSRLRRELYSIAENTK